MTDWHGYYLKRSEKALKDARWNRKQATKYLSLAKRFLRYDQHAAIMVMQSYRRCVASADCYAEDCKRYFRQAQEARQTLPHSHSYNGA